MSGALVAVRDAFARGFGRLGADVRDVVARALNRLGAPA